MSYLSVTAIVLGLAVTSFDVSRTTPCDPPHDTDALKVSMTAMEERFLQTGSGFATDAATLPQIETTGDGAFPRRVLFRDRTLVLNGTGLCEWGVLGIDLYTAALSAFTFTAEPGTGLWVQHDGRLVASIPDPKFANLFVLLYLGDKPPTRALRDGLLGSNR
ncbi:MAG: chalcone isomerase family protein [Planctomycetota bacterium]